MEETSGTEPVIQGVAAPMVAVPAPAQALLARSAGFGGTMPGIIGSSGKRTSFIDFPPYLGFRDRYMRLWGKQGKRHATIKHQQKH